METVIYKNRYNDPIIFKKISDNQVEMVGGKFIRFSFDNNFIKAYEEYCKDNSDQTLSLNEFTEKIYEPNKETGVYNFSKYHHLVMKTGIINMVDPSGGPYLCTDTNLRLFGFEEDLIIDNFEFKEGYILINIKS